MQSKEDSHLFILVLFINIETLLGTYKNEPVAIKEIPLEDEDNAFIL